MVVDYGNADAAITPHYRPGHAGDEQRMQGQETGTRRDNERQVAGVRGHGQFLSQYVRLFRYEGNEEDLEP
jgi:hypothetical protein